MVNTLQSIALILLSIAVIAEAINHMLTITRVKRLQQQQQQLKQSLESDVFTITKVGERRMEREKEILRQQLELLAERSKECDNSSLVAITEGMVLLYSALSSSDLSVL